MKHWFILLLVFPLVACSGPTQTPDEPVPELPAVSSLPDLSEAPELINDVWLNTDTPLRLADLRGKVVLLDMWTFG